MFGSDVAAGRDDDLLDPRVDAAKIRALFIHPDWARRGLGTMMLEACELRSRPGLRASRWATLTGRKPFVPACCEVIEEIAVPLDGGVSLPVIRMRKGKAS